MLEQSDIELFDMMQVEDQYKIFLKNRVHNLFHLHYYLASKTNITIKFEENNLKIFT